MSERLPAFLLGAFAGLGLCILTVILLGTPDRATRWSVEVLRTSDARGLTYSSLHDAQGEPSASGSVLRWTDHEGRRWVFISGALAHELPQAAVEKP